MMASFTFNVLNEFDKAFQDIYLIHFNQYFRNNCLCNDRKSIKHFNINV